MLALSKHCLTVSTVLAAGTVSTGAATHGQSLAPPAVAGAATIGPSTQQEQQLEFSVLAAAGAASKGPTMRQQPPTHRTPAAAGAATTGPGMQEKLLTHTTLAAVGAATKGPGMHAQPAALSVPADAASAAIADPGDGAAVTFR